MPGDHSVEANGDVGPMIDLIALCLEALTLQAFGNAVWFSVKQYRKVLKR